MNTALTETSAKDLGRSLRFIRHARNLTLRDVAKAAGISLQYVQNMERGQRFNVSEEAYLRLARGYGVPESVVADFLFRARVMTALERRGLDPEQQKFIWRGIEQRVSELGVSIDTDIGRVITSLV